VVVIHAIDGIFNAVSGFMEKVAKWIPSFDIPWDTFFKKWGLIGYYLRMANVLFPVDDLLTIMGLVVTFLSILMILWGIKFLKEMIPFI
jgi:hypothetical protein